MKTLGLLAVMALLIYSCSPKSGASSSEKFAKYADSEGKTLFMDKCGRCHGYKLPETRSADKWVKVIDRMAPKARLNADQKAAVLTFVQQYAKS
ncbi:hypothetical protein LX64_02993 [Chitinophaga skermanii]|uniref:Cytochrome c domain-containing protein n=1 Tax=Chitinophaga skermanii TaxID=331697 RepID=A0A327QJE2_9BACT|nr:cytochrome C [Chitinophaga skermanii]RAJ04115.1 hypothetical protein LX64_02993 [Chitinophaga skermanii]